MLVYRYVKQLIKRFGPQFYIAILLMIFLGLSESIGLIALLPLLELAGVSFGIPNDSRIYTYLQKAFSTVHISPTLGVVLLLFLATISIVAYAQHLKDSLCVKMQHELTRNFRNAVYESILQANWLFISKNKLAEHTHIITTEASNAGMIALHLMTAINTCILLMALATVTLITAPLLTLYSIGGLLALLIVLRGQIKRSKQLGKDFFASLRNLYQETIEQLGGIKNIKSCGQEHQQAIYFGNISASIRDRMQAMQRVNSQTRLLSTICAALIFCGVLYTAIEWVHASTASLLMLLFIFVRLLPKALALLQSYHQVVGLLPSYAAIEKLQRDCAANREETTSLPTGVSIALDRELSLSDIRFGYNDSGVVLDRLSLTFPAKAVTLICGPSGAGKSTLADIMAGLLMPQSGKLHIDGTPLDPKDIYRWRKSVSYVTQDPFLFHDTIRNNLLWGNSGATDETIWQALNKAAADDFVRTLPENLNTIIGDRGVALSGGQRQRIVLARALIKNPTLLFLDEAMSALDPENEASIFSALKKMTAEMTVVAISHRPESAKHADKIIQIA